jgi:hypothetical protein
MDHIKVISLTRTHTHKHKTNINLYDLKITFGIYSGRHFNKIIIYGSCDLSSHFWSQRFG